KTQVQQQVFAPEREEQSQRPASQSQQHAFGEQLPHEAETSRAQRQTHSNLFLSLRRARKQQVSHIDARDQQDQPDHGHQQVKRLPLIPAPVRVTAPARLNGESWEILRGYLRDLSLISRVTQIFERRTMEDWFEFGARLFRRHARLQSPHHQQPPVRPLIQV